MSLKNHFVADSDMHVMEPPDLWERYIDPEFRHVAPKGLSDMKRDMRVMVKSRVLLKTGRVHPRAAIPQGGGWREDHDDAYAASERQGWDSQSQLDAMNAEGLDMAVMFPSRGLFVLGLDSVEMSGPDGLEPKFAAAIARAYNDWMYDFCSLAPARMFGAGNGGAALRRGRCRRGASLRRGVRLQGGLPVTGCGFPPTLAPPGLRPPVG
jgi:predicted TIM-barrel fold metal-dependent hydrolase